MRTASRAMIALLACAVSFGLAPSTSAQTTPTPSPGHGGSEIHGGDHDKDHLGPGPMGDPVAMFAAALNLTADQQTQIKAVFEAMHPQMKAVEDDTTLSQDERMAKMKDLRDATHAKIKALLTPDQQQKFDE